MVINACFGQRSNRIIQIAHGLATAIEKHLPVRITEMSDLQKDYSCEVSWPGRVDLRQSLFWRFERVIHNVIQGFFGYKLCFPGVVTDWSYRDYTGVEKWHLEITKFFAPKLELVEKAARFWRERVKGKVVVGVHVRRGDYREWNGGRFFYEDKIYVANILSVVKDLSSRGPITVMLFSNEDIDMSNFQIRGVDVVLSRGSAIEDHFLMSKCDYLFGPPSTFSRWGAYMGRKPLAFIKSREETLRIKDFKYMSI